MIADGVVCTAKGCATFERLVELAVSILDRCSVSTVSSVRILHHRRSSLQYIRLRRSQGKSPATSSDNRK